MSRQVLAAPRFQSNLNRYIGFGLLGLVVMLALIGPLIAQYSPTRSDFSAVLQAPSAEHWFGTNSYGADVFSRLVHAARLDLSIGFFSVAIALLIGAPLGALIGMSHGSRLSSLGMRILDFVQSFPLFILAMALVAVTGQSTLNVALVLMVLSVPIFARLVRSEVLALRGRAFVEAARCSGNGEIRLVVRHILPNAMGAATAQASAQIGWALLLIAGLSFVGAGVQPPTPEWGRHDSRGS